MPFDSLRVGGWVTTAALFFSFSTFTSIGQDLGSPIWQYEGPPDQICLSPTEGSDGTIYISMVNTQAYGGELASLQALRPDGALRWRRGYSELPLTVPVATSDGAVVIGNGHFLHWIASDGTALASLELTNNLLSDLALGPENTVILSLGPLWGPGPELTGALGRDGSVKWIYTNDPWSAYNGQLARVLDGSRRVLMASNGRLRAVADGGLDLWATYLAGTPRGGAALGDDGAVFLSLRDTFGGQPEGVTAIEPDGSLRWSSPGSHSFGAPVLGPGGTVYVGAEPEGLWAFDAATGSNQWSYSTAGAVRTAPLATADGTVVCGDDAGRVYALSAGGALLWGFDSGSPVTGAPLALADGQVVVGTSNGMAWCLRADIVPASNGWSSYQQGAARTGLNPAPAVLPGLPSEVEAGAVDGVGGTIRLTWRAATGAHRYEVWRAQSANLAEALPVATNVTVNLTYDDDDAEYGLDYVYWVRGVNVVGAGPFSESVTARQSSKLWEVRGVFFYASVAVGTNGDAYATLIVPEPGSVGGIPSAVALGPGYEGRIRWTVPMPGPVIAPPTVGGDGTVYYLTGLRPPYLLVALDQEGNLRFERELTREPKGFLTMGSDGLMFYRSTYECTALDSTGHEVWSHSMGQFGSASSLLTATEDGLVCGADSSGIKALRQNGLEGWFYAQRNAGPVIAGQGGIVIGHGNRNPLIALDAQGRLLWERPQAGSGMPPSLGEDGSLWLSGNNPAVLAPDGTEVWVSPTRYNEVFPASVTEDGVGYYAVNESASMGRILGVRKDGTVVVDFGLSSGVVAPPVLGADGSLYVLLRSNRLQVFQAGRPAASGWPMYRANPQGTGSVAPLTTEPRAPTDLTAVPSVDGVWLRWSPTGQWATNEIWRSRSVDLEDAVRVGEVAPDQGMFFDALPADEGPYYYALRARSLAGTSAASLPAEGKPAQGVHLLWRCSLPENPGRRTQPVVASDGTVYVRNEYEKIWAVNRDGSLRWEYASPGSGCDSAVLGRGGELYLATQNGLRVLDPNGQESAVWEPDRQFVTAPAVAGDGRLYVGEGGFWLGCYAADGTRLWGRELGSPIRTGPVVSPDDSVFLALENGTLWSFASDGNTNWTVSDTLVSGGLALDWQGRLYGCVTGHGVVCYGPSGQVEWETPVSTSLPSQLTIDERGVVYGVGRDSVTPTRDKSVSWLSSWTAQGEARPAVALEISMWMPVSVGLGSGGVSYTMSGTNMTAWRDDRLDWVFVPDEPAVHLPPEAGPPVVDSEGRLLFTLGRSLFALQTPNPVALDAPWPTKRYSPRGTASLSLPRQTRLNLQSGEGGLVLVSDEPVAEWFLLWTSTDLLRWESLTQQVGSGSNLHWNLPPTSERAGFYRLLTAE